MGSSAINCHLLLNYKEENYKTFKKYSEGGYIIQIEDSNWISYYDENSDGDVEKIKEIALKLSKEFSTKALVFDLFDSDVFSYYLIDNGNLVDSYCSNPNYFDNGDAEINAVEHGRILCNTLKVDKSLEDIVKVLDDGGYAFEEERVESLAEILGIDPIVASSGYDDIEDVEDYLEEKIVTIEI